MTGSHATQRGKLTREWGDRWAALLWDEFLGRFEIDWTGTTVLDFGCAAGYMTKHLVEQAGVREAHGVDVHPTWEAMIDGFRPDVVDGVHLHCGDALELPELQCLHFDVIISTGTLFLFAPTRLMTILHWFHDHLKPGGRCLLQTRTYTSHDGAALGERAPEFAHLLFAESEIESFLARTGAAHARYVNPSCASTYLAQFCRAGFSIERVDREHEHIDEHLFAQHAAKLKWLDPNELRTSGLTVQLQRPMIPDLSVVDRDAAGD